MAEPEAKSCAYAQDAVKLIDGSEVVRPRGVEPLTYSFGGCRSIQLSYGRITL